MAAADPPPTSSLPPPAALEAAEIGAAAAAVPGTAGIDCGGGDDTVEGLGGGTAVGAEWQRRGGDDPRVPSLGDKCAASAAAAAASRAAGNDCLIVVVAMVVAMTRWMWVRIALKSEKIDVYGYTIEGGVPRRETGGESGMTILWRYRFGH